MTKITSYRDLIAWQKGMDLVVLAYRESSKLPRDERFGLSVQIRRCAVSAPSNIAGNSVRIVMRIGVVPASGYS